MRRLTQSGFVLALVSGFSACKGGGAVPDSRMSAATSAGGTSTSATSPPAGLGGNDARVANSAGAGAGGASTSRPARVLLYSFSTLNIPSLPAQLDIVQHKLEQWHFQVDRSVDPLVFTDQSLAKYAAVAMINTCFFPFGANRSGEAEAQVLQKFLRQGGGLFGTHCADVTFRSPDPVHLYNRLMGGRASRENFEGESDCYKMGEHPTIAALPATFVYNGNLDDTDFLATDAAVLIRCKWRGGGQKDIAVSWQRSEGSGRVFFSNFAKVDSDFADPTIGESHLFAGLAWVLGR